PEFVIRTSAARHEDRWAIRPSGTWSSLRAASDDGGRVAIAIYEGDFRFPNCRLEIWDTRTGADLTAALWRDAEWQRLLSAPYWRDAGVLELLTQPTGKALLSDEVAWSALRRRLTTRRAKALEDLRKSIRPVEESEARDFFPRSISFAPDGIRLAYVVRN